MDSCSHIIGNIQSTAAVLNHRCIDDDPRGIWGYDKCSPIDIRLGESGGDWCNLKDKSDGIADRSLDDGIIESYVSR